MGNPVGGKAPRLRVGGKDLVHRLGGFAAAHCVHDLFRDIGHFEKADPAVDEGLEGRFFGCVHHRALHAAALQRDTGKAQGRKALLVRRLEIEPRQPGEIQPLYIERRA